MREAWTCRGIDKDIQVCEEEVGTEEEELGLYCIWLPEGYGLGDKTVEFCCGVF